MTTIRTAAPLEGPAEPAGPGRPLARLSRGVLS